SRFMLEEPELPGVHDLLAFTKSHLARGFTSSDLDILSGALYLEAEHQLHGNRPGQAAADVPSPTRQRRPITADDVRAALSKPISTAAYGREYFKKRCWRRPRQASRPIQDSRPPDIVLRKSL